jgi:hypothetical protein
MKTTAILLISVFMVFSAIKTVAQVSSTNTNPKASPSRTDVNRIKDPYSSSGSGSQSRPLDLAGVEGQKYLGSDWPQGIVVLRDGKTIDTYLLRYDILADQMQFIDHSDTLAFASPQELKTLSFGGRTFVYENYKCENTVRQGYFELIVPGKNRLLLKRIVTYQVPDENNPMEEAKTKYYVDECYFISKQGEPSDKILCNRKSALSVLNNHEDDIEAYMRITGNKVHTTDDLKDLVVYYNSLDE